MNKHWLLTLSLLWTSTLLLGESILVCETCECRTISEAVACASDGDSLLIAPGTYQEGNILIDKSLVITGEDYPVLDGNNETEILTIRANDVQVIGLQIQNVGTSYIEDRAGIRVEKAKRFVIRDNRLYNTFFGIYLAHAKDGQVYRNHLKGKAVEQMSSGNGIHAWYCSRLLIQDNVVEHHRDGIYFEFVDESIIQRNRSTHNLRYGLHFMFSDHDEYRFNIFQNNGAGVAVMFSKFIQMENNRFSKNWGRAAYGLLLKEIYDAEILDNAFTSNTIGIYVEGSTRINYHRNTFARNGWGIQMSGGCLDNNMTENNFLGNTFDLAMNNNHNHNSIDGNYWSEYNGYDLDRDGVGDVPFAPVKLFSYVVDQSPEAIVLLRSGFVDLLNLSEKISPVFKPAQIEDRQPAMRKFSSPGSPSPLSSRGGPTRDLPERMID